MLTLLHLLSAVALLVWGTHIVRTGVMRVFGARLRTVLSRSVEKKPLAFCAGIGVTALVQSSNATTMLVTSFVAQDLVALAPALVIVLGADVGTALMARILTFDLSWLSPLLIFIGVIFFLGRKQSRAGQLGRVGIGLGLILLALELIVQAVTPITQANGVQVIFASLTGDILLDALIGAMFAIISYSSLAAVLLTATLTAAGIISFPVALCLVIGANLGSGLLAMLNNSAANAAGGNHRWLGTLILQKTKRTLQQGTDKQIKGRLHGAKNRQPYHAQHPVHAGQGGKVHCSAYTGCQQKQPGQEQPLCPAGQRAAGEQTAKQFAQKQGA
mgnify:CR=1 FL=1